MGHFNLHATLVLAFFSVLCLQSYVIASEGDRSPIFVNCFIQCVNDNCTYENSSSDGDQQIVVEPYYLQLFWSCQDDCAYDCMWHTVSVFQKQGWGVPQFFGRWPFVRVLGLQEPASVVFSLFNLVANLKMLTHFQSKVHKSVPCYYLWTTYSWVSINAWFWSSVFHSRDNPLTEMMDYFCAFSMVLFSFYSMVMRIMHCRVNCLSVIFSVFCGSLMVLHVTYLALLPRFDYGYNMKANITIGVLNALGWLVFCLYARRKQPYVWRCALSVVLALAASSLEILDFAPILWAFDAHALWHLSTALLPFLWYKFITDDCQHLQRLKQRSEDLGDQKERGIKEKDKDL